MAAVVDEARGTMSDSVLDRATPVLKHLREPMEVHTQSRFQPFLARQLVIIEQCCK